MDLALAGQDLQHFPKYYAPYAERTATVLGRAQPMAHLRRDDAVAAKIVDEWLAGSRLRENDVRYVALRARHAWIGVLIDSQTAQPVKMLIVEKI